MVYKWTFTKPVPAQEAGEELERIERKYGEVTAQNVLDESRSEKAVLHSLFEWDDREAAEQYRLRQATGIIQTLVVVAEEGEQTPTVRAFVNTTGGVMNTKGSFQHITAAMSDEQTRAFVLSQAKAELRAFERKYNNLQEFAGVMGEIQKVTA